MQPLHYELRCPAAEDNPEHPLLITINRENFILLRGFEINRKYIDFRAEKINRKNGFSKVKINREFLYFSLFLFCPLLLMFLLISKVRLWCETSMPRTFCKGVWADLLQGQAPSSSKMSNAEGSLVYKRCNKI